MVEKKLRKVKIRDSQREMEKAKVERYIRDKRSEIDWFGWLEKKRKENIQEKGLKQIENDSIVILKRFILEKDAWRKI